MTLFFRHGEAFEGSPAIEKGRPLTVKQMPCNRCGGAGGSDKWKPTGWTCFNCGGSGKGPLKTFKLYTAEQLAKLNATAAKKAAKKAAAAQVVAEAREREVEARRERFRTLHGDLLAKAREYASRSEFVADVIRKAEASCNLTEGQECALLAAIGRFEDEDAKKAASRHVGKAGERIETKVTVERIAAFETQWGLSRIVTMRDEAGNAIVAKGRYSPSCARWDPDLWRYEIDKSPFRIRATIKGHDYYRDERQTIIQRVKEVAG